MSSKLSVGIHILTVLALHRGEPLTSEVLACSVNTNAVVIRRLLGRFRKAGYVGSKPGVRGGWLLAVDPGRISLLEVLRAVEPRDEAFALHRSPPDKRCPVGCNIQDVLCAIYADVREGMSERLARSTIATVVDALHAHAPG